MAIASHLRSHVRAAKERLAEGRARLRERHGQGALGLQISQGLAELFDAVVLDLFEAALAELGANGLREELALVAHGGYGRRDVAPFSDVDLMILHAPRMATRVQPLAQRIVRDVCDAGLVLGHSVRTAAETCQLARKDPVIYTSLIESRLLGGSQELLDDFVERFRRQTRRRVATRLGAIDKARRVERAQYGETVYLLEPNVKRSRGGLRDIQFVRWVGFTRYGVAEPEDLRLRGLLTRGDYEALHRAHEFLLRLRNEMHFHAGKANDLLDHVEQLRLAERYGYPGDAGLLPVEQFMREYFRLTDGVSRVAARFLSAAGQSPGWRELFVPLFSHQCEGDFRVSAVHIAATRRGLPKLSADLAQIVRLADLANHYDKPIAPRTCEAIRAAVDQLPDEISGETAQRFLSLLEQPARLGEMLRTLYDLGVLEKIIPAFRHARCLLQFNEYHKYTVDEHCLRAVGEATSFARDAGPLGLVYRHIKRKWLLHLALLLHDLGKGYSEDHSQVGLRIAQETAARLGLPERDAEALCFLVHKHLLMSHLAFRRDTSDDQLVVRFAVEVGSPETLQMLFVLTAADLAAVGPGVLNAWKVEVLADLHARAMRHLAGEAPALRPRVQLEKIRGEVQSLVSAGDDRAWFETQLAALPASYLTAVSAEQAAAELRQLHALDRGDVLALGRYLPETGAVEYKVGAYEELTPGVFHKLTGALSGRGLQILSAEIHTLADGLIFDRFYVHDPDFAGPPPQERIDEVCQVLSAALRATDGGAPAFRRVWRPGEQRRTSALVPLPTQVRIDNNTSDRFTIIDVFAADRMGLLYTIARALFESGLSVSVAKIGTYLDQVVDVFYVTDRQGAQIADERLLGEVRGRVLAAIDELERTESQRAKPW